MRAYQQTPEYKAKMRAYQQTPEYKAKMRAYQQTPEYKAKKRAYYNQVKKTPEYKASLGQRQCSNCDKWEHLRKANVNGKEVWLCKNCISN